MVAKLLLGFEQWLLWLLVRLLGLQKLIPDWLLSGCYVVVVERW